MRRHTVLALVLALTVSVAQAQVPLLLQPTPLGTVLTVFGYLTPDKKKIYYAKVLSQGKTFEAARAEGFKLAIEQAIGPLVLSESHGQNGRLVRDQIISYSSGMVDRFNIIAREETAYGTALTMEVWVAHSNIANRLLNESTAGSTTIDGNLISARTQTLLHERQQADNVVTAVMRDFPLRSFNLQQTAWRSTLNANQDIILMMSWTVSWNREFLDSLWSAMEATSHKPKSRCLGLVFIGCVSAIEQMVTFSIRDYSPMRELLGQTSVYFLDANKTTIVENTVLRSKPVVKIIIYNTNGVESVVRCNHLPVARGLSNYGHQNTYMLGDSHGDLQVNAVQMLQGEFHINMGQNTNKISQFDKTQLSVVDSKDCKAK